MKGAWAAAGALFLLAGCDWVEQAQGTHLPAITTDGKTGGIGFIPRALGPVGTPDSALQCIEAKEIGSPYPMTLWVKLGSFPGASVTALPNGGWTVGDLYVPSQLGIRIDRKRFEATDLRLTLSPEGDLTLTGNAPTEDALFQAVARARTMNLITGAQERSLAVAVWRKELIAISELCEKNALAWQFLQ